MTISDDFYYEVQNAVAKLQPELTVLRSDTLVILEGLFVVSGPSGPFDSYQIKAEVTGSFPADEPVVFEEGGRIPRIADRHVFPDHGNCCLGVWEQWLLTAQDHRFETFLTGPMHDYFVSQTYYEVHGKWPFGDRSHGEEGVIESFAELLGVAEDARIIADHLRLLSRAKAKGHAPCPCGSGQRLRHCHMGRIEEQRRQILPTMAKRMLARVTPK